MIANIAIFSLSVITVIITCDYAEHNFFHSCILFTISRKKTRGVGFQLTGKRQEVNKVCGKTRLIVCYIYQGICSCRLQYMKFFYLLIYEFDFVEKIPVYQDLSDIFVDCSKLFFLCSFLFV